MDCSAPGAHVFAIIDGLAGRPDPLDLARALRRAVMARVQSVIGNSVPVSSFFTGHAEDGTPVRRSSSAHLTFAFDPEVQRFLVIAPHLLERRKPEAREIEYLDILVDALQGFSELRSGRAGLLSLSNTNFHVDLDPISRPSVAWTTISPYVVTRHAKRCDARQVLIEDVLAECRRLELPVPAVASKGIWGASGMGLTAHMTLVFEKPISGPLLIGRTRYLGGGLLRAVP